MKNKYIRTISALLLTGALIIGLSACGRGASIPAADTDTADVEEEEYQETNTAYDVNGPFERSDKWDTLEEGEFAIQIGGCLLTLDEIIEGIPVERFLRESKLGVENYRTSQLVTIDNFEDTESINTTTSQFICDPFYYHGNSSLVTLSLLYSGNLDDSQKASIKEGRFDANEIKIWGSADKRSVIWLCGVPIIDTPGDEIISLIKQVVESNPNIDGEFRETNCSLKYGDWEIYVDLDTNFINIKGPARTF